jgi:hypothetical protein
MGHLIPAGTGQKKFKDIVVSAPEPGLPDAMKEKEISEEVITSEVETKKLKRKVKLVE